MAFSGARSVAQRPFSTAAFPLLLIIFTLLTTHPATAANAVVGNGTAVSCTEAKLDSALATVIASGSGTVTFDCGSDPIVLLITNEKQISNATVTIDGGGKVTLDGNNSTRHFYVFAGTLHLQNIRLEHGFKNTSDGGSIYNSGILTLDNTTIAYSSTSSIYSGGAIVSYGPMTIENSLFEHNVAGNGGALYLRFADGSATIRNTTFDQNRANNTTTTKWGGAILLWGADVTIEGSTFTLNEAKNGGAIYNPFDYATVTLEPGNVFSGNYSNGNGGALWMGGETLIDGNTFWQNTAVTDGGAIFSAVNSNLTVTKSTFDSNESLEGGAISFSGTRLIVHDDVFNNNAADDQGGAIYISGGDLDVERTQFTYNTAVDNGGAISCFSAFVSVIESALAYNEVEGGGGAVFSACSLNMSNLTLSNNRATDPSSEGGAIYQSGNAPAFIQYATIANNTAVSAGGIYNGVNGSSVTISRSIVAHNNGGNCSNGIGSDGYNLSNNATCPNFTKPGDKQNATLPLAPFGNNGGSTGSRLPLAGNEAIDAIPTAQCAASTDQRGGTRPTGDGCDSGAIEVGGYKWLIFLPTLTK